MGHIERTSLAGNEVHCFDTPTNQNEVSSVLHDLIRTYGNKRNIWVISGTHGYANGTVDAGCHTPDFKYEDRDTASVTSRLIHSVDFHQLSQNRWREMREKGVLVLAWCYSEQWFQNNPF